MSNWIKSFADEERARIAAIESFNAAVPGFMKLLLAAIQSDLSQFEQEFTGQQVKASIKTTPKESIVVTRQMEHLPASALLETIPPRRAIQCSYKHCYNEQTWEMQMELSNLGIHFPSRTIETTLPKLSRAILQPILFPDIHD